MRMVHLAQDVLNPRGYKKGGYAIPGFTNSGSRWRCVNKFTVRRHILDSEWRVGLKVCQYLWRGGKKSSVPGILAGGPARYLCHWQWWRWCWVLQAILSCNCVATQWDVCSAINKATTGIDLKIWIPRPETVSIGRAWTELTRSRAGTIGGQLRTRWCNFGFHKMREFLADLERNSLCDFTLPRRSRWELRSSELLRSG